MIDTFAVFVPSLTGRLQLPAATGVTVNWLAFGPATAVAIVVDPETQAPVVKLPVKPVSLAVNVWFAPEPVAVNDRDDGVSTIEAGTGVGVGVAVGTGVGVGVAVGTGVGVGVAVGAGVGVGVAVGVAVGVGVETSTP